jgi:hypothetical protein
VKVPRRGYSGEGGPWSGSRTGGPLEAVPYRGHLEVFPQSESPRSGSIEGDPHKGSHGGHLGGLREGVTWRGDK